MYILNKVNAIKIAVKHLEEFIAETYYKHIGFTIKDSYCLLKKSFKKYLLFFANDLTEKLPDFSKSL